MATPRRLRNHAGATGRPLDILPWCVQALLALVFVGASWAKLTGKPEMAVVRGRR